MRIGLFTFGAADFVNAIHRTLVAHGHQLAVLVVTRYLGQGRLLSSARLRWVADVDPAVPILVTNHLEPIGSALEGFGLDMILVRTFSRRLPASILEIPRLGCVNVHPSWLPRYRGPDPVPWQLYNGETSIGITCHRMDAELDTGPILLQWTMPIELEDNLQSVRRGVYEQTVRRLPELLHLVESGVPGTVQDDAQSTYAPRFTERERTIDWSRSAREIVNQIRAVGDAGAIASLNGGTYRIMRAEVLGDLQSTTELPEGEHLPGTVVRATDDSLVIATGDGILRVLSFRPQ
jgi:methionyl-tRNA formyltransferase